MKIIVCGGQDHFTINRLHLLLCLHGNTGVSHVRWNWRIASPEHKYFGLDELVLCRPAESTKAYEDVKKFSLPNDVALRPTCAFEDVFGVSLACR